MKLLYAHYFPSLSPPDFSNEVEINRAIAEVEYMQEREINILRNAFYGG